MITIYDWFGYELPIKERYPLMSNIDWTITMKKIAETKYLGPIALER